MLDRSDSPSRHGGNPLHDVLALRRWLRVLVYPAVTLLIPLDHFLLGLSWPVAVVSHLGGYVIAVVAVELAMLYSIRLKKRAIYPSLLVVELESTRDLRQGCQRAVQALARWLKPDAVGLAFLQRDSSALEALATYGYPPGTVRFDAELDAHMWPIRDAMRQQRIWSEPIKDGHPWFAAFGPGHQSVYVPVVAMDTVVGVLNFVGNKRLADLRDRTLLAAIARIVGLTLDNVRLYNHEYQAILHILCSALDLRDRVTEGHSRRVADLSLAVASQFGIEGDKLVDIERAAILHDIGKVSVPDAILSKPGPLTPGEWEIMRTHPEVGYQMVKDVPFLHRPADIIHAHHERFDGGGYPRGLKGQDIPLGARIFGVVDAYDAITSDRPYRRARLHEQALEEIQRHVGTQFDPDVVEAFLRAERRGLISPDGGSPALAAEETDRQLIASLFPPVM